MASGFIGISVAVTLQNPPNTVVHGVVAAVNAQTATLTLRDVFFPASGHRLGSYHVEGQAIADIKVDGGAGGGAGMGTGMGVGGNGSGGGNVVRESYGSRPPAPFVDPAIVSVGKQSAVAPPQEAPATPMKPAAGAVAAPVPGPTPSFAGHAKIRNVRKPSAATLEGPFSSLDIADAEEADSETKTAMQPAVRRVSITKTRTGKPMDDPSPQKNDDGGKRTRRGGKARKKELAAQERKNGGDVQFGPDGARKGYVCAEEGCLNGS